MPYEEASRYGVCDTNEYGEIVNVVEKPEGPQSNLVMTGFYTFTPAIFHAANLVHPSDRGEYELSDAIDLLIESGRTIDAISVAERSEATLRASGERSEPRAGWTAGGPSNAVRGTSRDEVPRWIDVGYPEDRDEAEKRLQEDRQEAAAE